MKKQKQIHPPKPVEYKGCAYGLEDDGIILGGLCGPSEQMDYIGGVFQHVGDAYYNCWPHQGENKWKMEHPGTHTTSDVEIVALALSKENGRCRITKRCANALLSAGYAVELCRGQSFTYSVTVETRLRFMQGDDIGMMPRIASQKTFVNGKEQ